MTRSSGCSLRHHWSGSWSRSCCPAPSPVPLPESATNARRALASRSKTRSASLVNFPHFVGCSGSECSPSSAEQWSTLDFCTLQPRVTPMLVRCKRCTPAPHWCASSRVGCCRTSDQRRSSRAKGLREYCNCSLSAHCSVEPFLSLAALPPRSYSVLLRSSFGVSRVGVSMGQRDRQRWRVCPTSVDCVSRSQSTWGHWHSA
ncbi:unannotated protein [freshwater metagenome]|uniref:Unannotated protein n=1 Tax=freshwater metagenome TaxID=449393 RepID=A0A6J6PIA0_9ZZZZ